ncbi:hypothetical protein AB1Y20_001266 [Prymnesium parvum]|uniref:Glycosyl transferase CAP10 domain-containing protein n=1 Tax=Prymnesium parvum TaxID=97485 RepID=A0AB34K7B0_PRYPA
MDRGQVSHQPVLANLAASNTFSAHCALSRHEFSGWYEQLALDLRPFQASGITQQMTQQAINYTESGLLIAIRNHSIYYQNILNGRLSNSKQGRDTTGLKMMFYKAALCTPLPDADLVWRHRDMCSKQTGDEVSEAYRPINWKEKYRSKLVLICNKIPDLCDAGITQCTQCTHTVQDLMRSANVTRSPLSSTEQDMYRYQVLMDGNGSPASRSLRALASGSTVLKQDSPYIEFWYRDLKPWVHYIPIRRDLKDFRERLVAAMSNPELSAKIARTGQKYRESISDVSVHVSRRYHTTEEEIYWRTNIDRLARPVTDPKDLPPGGDADVDVQALAAWSNGSEICGSPMRWHQHVIPWLEYVSERHSASPGERAALATKWRSRSAYSFPSHEIHNACTNTTTFVPIEPLVSHLRHPLWACGNLPGVPLPLPRKAWSQRGWTGPASHGVDKNYMILPFDVDIAVVPGTRYFFFDLGGSTYRAGGGGASQSWFVESFAKSGIEFDRILVWEATPMKPKQLFEEYPLRVLSKLSYFNVPINASPSALHNPLRVLRVLVKPEDYVVIKIDIDHPKIELPLMAQIVQDSHLVSLIDELFFEHHVQRSPMAITGWGMRPSSYRPVGSHILHDSMSNIRDGSPRKHPPSPDDDIVTSYELFHWLRSHGVRAHAWV